MSDGKGQRGGISPLEFLQIISQNVGFSRFSRLGQHRAAEVLDFVLEEEEEGGKRRKSKLRMREGLFPMAEIEEAVEDFLGANLEDPRVVEELMDKFKRM